MRFRPKFVLMVLLPIMVTLGPFIAIDHVVRWVAVEQGSRDMKDMAGTMIGHAEKMLDAAVGSLDILANEELAGCSRANIRRLSEVVFTRSYVKEIGIAGFNGHVLCSNFGPSFFTTNPIDGVASATEPVVLSMLATRTTSFGGLGVRRVTRNGALIAYLDPKAIHLDLLHGEIHENCFGGLHLSDGTIIDESGDSLEQIEANDPNFVNITVKSSRYPIQVTLAGTRDAFVMPFAAIQGYAKIGSGLLSISFLIIFVYVRRQRSTLEEEIDEAIEVGQFITHYQPIVDASSGRVSGCEALIRWQKPNGEIVPPDLFVPVAEASGQIMEITNQLMQRVEEELGALIEEVPNFYVSINLVADHFRGEEIVDEVRRYFHEGRIRPKNLLFEITERRPLEDIEVARHVVEELQATGARVALDDAGTGHGGLAYIQGLGMDIIKIDRMFVEAIGTGAVSAPIVDTLLELGSQLGMNIVAEGVETEEQFFYLQQRGTRYFQGYLFSPPLPPNALIKFVQTFNASEIEVRKNALQTQNNSEPLRA